MAENDRGTIDMALLDAIGEAIQYKLESEDTYLPGQMPDAIRRIETGITPEGTIPITENGTVDVTTFAAAAVNVPNSYTAQDGGKVVQDGELVQQTSADIDANGAYDTTKTNEVTVAVPPPAGTLARLGTSTAVEALPALYGPMGDLTNDTITPVSYSGREDVTIRTSQFHTIRVVFRLSSRPTAQAAIFGRVDDAHDVPEMYVEAGGNNIRFYVPLPPDSEGHGAIYHGGPMFASDTPLPLDTDIAASIRYDATGIFATVRYGNTVVTETVNTGGRPLYGGGPVLLGYDERRGNGLAGFNGAYINAQESAIIQGTTRLWGGTLPVPAIQPLTITENGDFTPPQGVDGFGPVHAAVPNAYAAEDEGKVVEDGALVAQTSRAVFSNGTYDTTANNSVIVNIPPATGDVLARLGTSTEIVTLRGLYGPMGDYQRDYVIPVDETTRQNVTITTAQPFEIGCAIRLTEPLPQDHLTDLFGDLSVWSQCPLIRVMYSNGYHFNLLAFHLEGTSIVPVQAAMNTPSGYAPPLNTDIELMVAWDGTDVTASLNDGANTYSASLTGFDLYANPSTVAFGTVGGFSNTLSDCEGSYLNINGCYIEQNGIRVWGPTGSSAVIQPLTVTQNGTYNPPAGVDGFGPVVVDVEGGGRCPRSEMTTLYHMDDFYSLFTFESIEESQEA